MSTSNKSLFEQAKGTRQLFENHRFCYGLEGGQGFVPEENCTCTAENPCQAKQDADRFHAYFDELGYDYEKDGAKRRSEIVQQMKPEFKDSFWWKHNVIE